MASFPRGYLYSTPVVSLSNHGNAGVAVLRQAQDGGGARCGVTFTPGVRPQDQVMLLGCGHDASLDNPDVRPDSRHQSGHRKGIVTVAFNVNSFDPAAVAQCWGVTIARVDEREGSRARENTRRDNP